jgi:protein-S-isoprenylcysteine O-methyltransferase Ste14
MDEVSNPGAAEGKKTGGLKPPTGPLNNLKPAEVVGATSSGGFFLRAVELAMFLVAVVGAVALGLGISDYFFDHTYIGAYLLAYAGFRCADLLVREDYTPDSASDALSRRIANQLPALMVFAAAPFERTYLYGGEPPSWLGVLGLLLELAGLWFALGARIQLAFFSSEVKDGLEHPVMVRSGFYRFVRHPTYAGVFLALFAWPLSYAAPISATLTLVIGAFAVQSLIATEEAELLARFGEEYATYRSRTEALIPGFW